jgi:hypothetical protein
MCTASSRRPRAQRAGTPDAFVLALACDRDFDHSQRGKDHMLKLPTHDRYDYSCIEKRGDYSWPDGKRLAFYLALNVEEFAFMAGRGNDPYLRTSSPQTQRN